MNKLIINFNTDEGKFLNKEFNEAIMDDTAFSTIYKELKKNGIYNVNPNNCKIEVIEQNLNNEFNDEHCYTVKAYIIF